MEHDLIIITSNNEVLKESQTVMSRAVQKAREQIMAQEDAEIFRVLDAIAAAESK